MWGVVVAAVITYGLVRAAAAEPARKKTREAGKLVQLCAIPRVLLTLSQAQDGAALARRFGRADLARSFEQDVRNLRKSLRLKGRK